MPEAERAVSDLTYTFEMPHNTLVVTVRYRLASTKRRFGADKINKRTKESVTRYG